MRVRYVPLILPVVAILASGTLAQEQSAFADLKDRNGAAVGRTTFSQTLPGGGVWIDVTVANLPPGNHGIHIHAVGRCDGDFTSSGGHFNPDGARHGFLAAGGPHAGDLPNLFVDSQDRGRLATANFRIALGSGANSLFDADGSALVIHAGADDYVTDPAGNSGDRIACGVITRTTR